MQNNYLDYLARINSAGLHAHRRKGTDVLTTLLSPEPGDSILELGCGTCDTLVRMSGTFPQCKFTGSDINSQMIATGRRRIRFCRADQKIKLDLSDSTASLPYSVNSFDIVYAESVLAIQPGENLPLLLKEIHRVIKPGGILLFNESVWHDKTPPELISEYNKLCLEYFGIIQSNAEYPYLSNWIDLADFCGFEILDITQPDSDVPKVPEIPLLVKLRSSLFNFGGRLKVLLNKDLRRQKPVFEKHITTLAKKFTKDPVTGVIFKLACRKN